MTAGVTTGTRKKGSNITTDYKTTKKHQPRGNKKFQQRLYEYHTRINLKRA
jgi:hypothetical protein